MLLLTWLVNALALLAVPYLMHSVQVDSFVSALIAALILGTSRAGDSHFAGHHAHTGSVYSGHQWPDVLGGGAIGQWFSRCRILVRSRWSIVV